MKNNTVVLRKSTRTAVAAMLIALTLGAGCTNSKLNIPDLQARANRLKTVYAPGVIQAIDALAAMPGVKANAEASALLARSREVAVKFEANVVPMANLFASIATINPSNKPDLMAKLSAASAAWNELAPLVSEIASKIAASFTDNEAVKLGITIAPTAITIALGLLADRVAAVQ